MKLVKPTANSTNLIYTGSAQEPEWLNYNSTYITKSGDAEIDRNDGYYTTKFNLKDTTNTRWSDNTTAEVSIDWRIRPKQLTRPSFKFNGSPVYDGNAHYPSENLDNWNDFDPDTMEFNEGSVYSAGRYTTTISVKDSWNYYFNYAGGYITEFTTDWRLYRSPTAKKLVSTTGSNYITVSSSATGISYGHASEIVKNYVSNADATNMARLEITINEWINGPDNTWHRAVFALNENYAWEDGSESGVCAFYVKITS